LLTRSTLKYHGSMYKTAYRHDEETVIYFDAFDNKWLAKGNSLSWRTNNPGLLHTREIGPIHSRSVIGKHHRVAIFRNAREGVEAFKEWLRVQKRQRNVLLIIAKRLKPDSIASCLDSLCRLASLPRQMHGEALTEQMITRLIGAVKTLTQFCANVCYVRVPKVAVRLVSKDGSVEFYVSSNDDFLTKEEAIDWSLSHKLDAVIVHDADGNILLRSRPRNHRNKIIFFESKSNLPQSFAYEDAVRETGKYRPGQCIWGFINGIWNFDVGAKETLGKISAMAGGEQVWSLINDFWPLSNGSLSQAVGQKFHKNTQVVQFAAAFFRLLISRAKDDPTLPIVVFCHSQGAIIADLALEILSDEERQRLRLFTFGGGTFIQPGKAHPDSHNYISTKDRISQGAEVHALMALRLHQDRKAGYSIAEIIAQLVEEDMALHLESTDVGVARSFCQQRRDEHAMMIQRIANVTVLDDTPAWIFEHAIDSECYQIKIQEVINRYKYQYSKVEKAL